ncbi:hypothetical protein RO785_04160, partial [Bacteroides cellulosilyticus]|nr:hypothetical protein [Bacteroides cellulosilyticus]
IQVNVIMPAAKLRPAVVGCPSRNCRLHSPQLENVEPTTAGRSLATGKRKKTIKQSMFFIRLSSHLSDCFQAFCCGM